MDLLPQIAHALAAALQRTRPYANLLPPTVVEDAREAVASYVAWCSIVQSPGTHNEDERK
jgi:hypothetical protein